jgi:hypothetical protein
MTLPKTTSAALLACAGLALALLLAGAAPAGHSPAGGPVAVAHGGDSDTPWG